MAQKAEAQQAVARQVAGSAVKLEERAAARRQTQQVVARLEVVWKAVGLAGVLASLVALPALMAQRLVGLVVLVQWALTAVRVERPLLCPG